MRIVHLADVHWRSRIRHDEYKKSFSEFFVDVSQLSPDAIVIVGDIVHSKTQGITPEVIDALVWWFRGLADIAPVHVALGNHDGNLYNLSQQDAISPILNALDHKNITLYKDSGVYPLSESFNLCVFSCFDKGNWKNVTPEDGKVNIALYHAPIVGARSDTNYTFEQGNSIDLFEGFDFALLGDIHQHQFLTDDRRIAYPGSTMLQDYGESGKKGYLLWDITSRDEFDVEFREIPNFAPHITIPYDGFEEVCEELARQKGARVRVVSDGPVSHADQQKLRALVGDDVKEIVFQTNRSNVSISVPFEHYDRLYTQRDLTDPDIAALLFNEHFQQLGLEGDVLKRVVGMAREYVGRIRHQSVARNVIWSLKRMKFDNTFSYGEGNVIDFEKMKGIVGIFGPNRIGKSSIVGTALYGLFNTTDRGSLKNLHVINDRKEECRVELFLDINGQSYVITRSTTRHEKKAGDEWASTALDIARIVNGYRVSENGTSRQDTEKRLTELIGSKEDFLHTSMATQGSADKFIKEGPSFRADFIGRMLGLDIFARIHDLVKEDAKSITMRMKLKGDIDWDEELDSLVNQRDEACDEQEVIKKKLDKARQDLYQTKKKFDEAQERHKGVDELDVCESSLERVRERTIQVTRSLDGINSQLDECQTKLAKCSAVKEKYDINHLSSAYENAREKKSELATFESDLRSAMTLVESQKRSVAMLDKVPCGDLFPSCPFIKDSHANKRTVEESVRRLVSLEESVDQLKIELDRMKLGEVKKAIDEYGEAERAQSTLGSQLIQLLFKRSEVSSELPELKAQEIELEKKLKLILDATAPEARKLLADLSEEHVRLKQLVMKLEKDQLRAAEKVGKIDHKLASLEREKKEHDELNDTWYFYQCLIEATSKKGLPAEILRRQLPVMNQEIKRVLEDVVAYDIIFEIDEESNRLNIFIDYGDSRRIIELGSGMEKFISAVAIRVALARMSSLPRSDIFILDEGFGSLDETQVEVCATRLLAMLKTMFRAVIVISHVGAIKEAADEFIELIRNGQDTQVSA